jgi:hypothetical protein
MEKRIFEKQECGQEVSCKVNRKKTLFDENRNEPLEEKHITPASIREPESLKMNIDCRFAIRGCCKFENDCNYRHHYVTKNP